ncbi:MmcQ/YjbR family DNA-binding protein [Chitinophaga defluvii]|uniref:MmcQ/YjbR family DNA-binding protein n=1 Tax=Chitinophaga defluvii TaxID=3163343 RepID=A0ABV2TAE8_9BACT
MFDLTLNYCLSFPAVVAEEKRDHEIRFSVGDKLFCMLSSRAPHTIAFKCTMDQFHSLICRAGIVPAPSLSRYHWVQVRNLDTLPLSELQALIQASYEMIVSTLPPEPQQGANMAAKK